MSYGNTTKVLLLRSRLRNTRNAQTDTKVLKGGFLRADLQGTTLSHVTSLRQTYDCRVRHKKCRTILNHVLKRCDNRSRTESIENVVSPVVSLSHATKSYRVNRPLRTLTFFYLHFIEHSQSIQDLFLFIYFLLCPRTFYLCRSCHDYVRKLSMSWAVRCD